MNQAERMEYEAKRQQYAQMEQAAQWEQAQQMDVQKAPPPEAPSFFREAYELVGDRVDADQDGAMLDDIAGWGVTGLGTVAGAAIGTVFGQTIPGAAIGYGVGSLGAGLARWGGDFIEDTHGTRQHYDPATTSDPSYKKGKPPTWGQQMYKDGYHGEDRYTTNPYVASLDLFDGLF